MYDDLIEKSMLYFIIFEGAKYELTEKDFVSKQNQVIIKAINELKRENQEISMQTISEKLRSKKAQVIKYLSTLGEYVLGTTAETIYSKMVEYRQKRELYELIKAYEEDEDEIGIVLEKMLKGLKDIQAKTIVTGKSFDEKMVSAINEIEKNYNNRNDYSLYTGLMDLDKKTLGLHKQELTIIGARPRSRKNNISFTDSRKYS